MKEVETEFLTEKEIQGIYSKKFRTPRLVRDIFIFCFFTGLAYVDVKGLRNDDIGIGIDGQNGYLRIVKKPIPNQKFRCSQFPKT